MHHRGTVVGLSGITAQVTLPDGRSGDSNRKTRSFRVLLLVQKMDLTFPNCILVSLSACKQVQKQAVRCCMRLQPA